MYVPFHSILFCRNPCFFLHVRFLRVVWTNGINFYLMLLDVSHLWNSFVVTQTNSPMYLKSKLGTSDILSSELLTAFNAALICDLWSSQNMESFLTITAHLFTTKSKLAARVLATIYVDTIYTSVNLAHSSFAARFLFMEYFRRCGRLHERKCYKYFTSRRWRCANTQ